MIDHPFQSRRMVLLSLLIGGGGLLVLGVQPIILGVLLSRKIINDMQLGWAATAEVFLMAVGLIAGSRLLLGRQTRWIAIVAGLAMAGANALTVASPNAAAVLMSRGIAGFSEGILISVIILSIAFSVSPGRLSALFLTVSAIPQLILAYLLPNVLMPKLGDNAGFVIMAIVGVFCALCVVAVDGDFAVADNEGSRRVRWTPVVLLALFGSLVTMAAVGAAWAYVEPLATHNLISPGGIGTALTVSVACQVLGSLFVAVVGWRLPPKPMLVAIAIFQVFAIAAVASAHNVLVLSLALGAFGFFWQASAPFATDLVVALDETRGTAPLVFPLSVMGLSAGPLIASFAVSSSIEGAAVTSAIGFVLGVGVYLAVAAMNVRRMVGAELSVR